MAATSAIEVGTELAPFARPAGFETWNRYAAVNSEFVPIHMDDEAGQAAGYPGAFGMGNLNWAWLHAMLNQWIDELGRPGRIVAVSCQFRGAMLRPNTVTAKGVVTEVREVGGETIVELDVWTEIGDGSKLAPGHATVALSA